VLVMVSGAIVAWNIGTTASAAEPLNSLVPAPVSVQPVAGVTHAITADTRIHTTADAHGVGDHLAALLRPSTGYALPVADTTGVPADGIALLLGGAPASVGDQGYQLTVTSAAVQLPANTPAGPWTVPGATITDYPRFAHRGAMLDVARHFHPVAAVKRYLDQLALYKVNYFHLHLTDDQGWRIVVDSRPRLATHGGSTQVGGGPGGYYTKAQYQEIVAYAAARGQKIVMSPANKAYLDMKYHSGTPLGLSWAGFVEVRDAYDWNPGTHVSGVPESAVRGVEAPLWTETIATPAHIDHMAFPRLSAIAELAWSPWSTHNWDAFRLRLGAQAPRWTAMGIDFYRSPQVPWADNGITTTTTTTTQPSGTWAPDRAYTAGTQVTYNGVTYQCRQSHTSLPGWEPPNVPALWQRL
jgi:hypothetical protein